MLTGFVAFAGSALLDNGLRVSLADQLVLTFITGGVTLLVQYLAEFEQRLRETQRYQRRLLDELRDTVQRGLAGVSEATTLMDDIERSALRKESLTDAIRRAGHVTTTTKPLLPAVADSESANGPGFEAGFWLTDLGGRYLDLQRSALRRGCRSGASSSTTRPT